MLFVRLVTDVHTTIETVICCM